MASATCLNETCDKGEWTLQKHPDDYARGVSCPECGTTRVDIDGAEDQNAARAPDTAGSQQRAAGGQAPARQDRGGGEDTFTSLIAVADSDVDTQKRAEGAADLLSKAGGMIQQFVSYQERKREAKETRAQNVGLEKATELPECVDCGFQFTPGDIGLDTDRVVCPDCGAVYNIHDAQ